MSAQSASSSVLPATQLRGHTAAVLCLAAAAPTSLHPHLLLSGSEDGSVRVWDLRTEKSVRCIKAFGSGEDAAVTAVAFHPKHEQHLLAASNNAIYKFDLRASSEIIVRSAQHRWQHNDEEVNCLAINQQGTFAAAADDNGEVKIIDMEKSREGQLYKSLKGQHTNLCTSVLFRPKTTWEVWSGGMDSQIVQWDFSKGRAMQTYSTNVSEAASASASQTLNPPFVNSMAFTRDGEFLFAASGNGEILLFDAKRKEERRRVTGHTHSVMHVGVVPLPLSFPCLSSFASPNLLLSAGNDLTILLWDLQALIDAPITTTAAAASPSSSSSSAAAKKGKKEKKSTTASSSSSSSSEQRQGGEAEEAADGVSTMSLDATSSSPLPPLLSSPSLPPSLAFSEPEHRALDTAFIRYRFKHPHKMNALATTAEMRTPTTNAAAASSSAAASSDSASSAATSGVSIFVTDVTNEITAYHLR